MKGENPFSRRELVKFFGADLAGAALTDALTVSEAQPAGRSTAAPFVDSTSKYPLRRAGQPAELASIYVQLAANDASYTTGNIYGAGGGAGQP
jgi:NAD(P)-dependent dehydrogenase (short-subunit alcohol dehydrogenase family)